MTLTPLQALVQASIVLDRIADCPPSDRERVSRIIADARALRGPVKAAVQEAKAEAQP